MIPSSRSACTLSSSLASMKPIQPRTTTVMAAVAALAPAPMPLIPASAHIAAKTNPRTHRKTTIRQPPIRCGANLSRSCALSGLVMRGAAGGGALSMLATACRRCSPRSSGASSAGCADAAACRSLRAASRFALRSSRRACAEPFGSIASRQAASSAPIVYSHPTATALMTVLLAGA
ncbi:hypothetical protein [Lysobacter gummosus]|uniref:hypothetical protein n=1 Tax=Lysobacter gummosus TaxID=262324 RepID=UPI0036339CBF